MHAQIPAMESLRVLREKWEDLTAHGVQVHATRAYGEAVGRQQSVRKVLELQNRKGGGE